MGGRWDPNPANPGWIADEGIELSALFIDVNENQVEATRRLAVWVNARLDDLPRKRILALGGNRRGGKSWWITAAALAVAVAIPGAIVYLVSPTLEKRTELERYIKGHAPRGAGFWRYVTKELSFVLPNGSTIKNVTGDDADAIKRGEADCVILNEPQLMAQEVFENAAPAIIDCGGIILLAGNPARKRKGVWFTRLVKLLDEKPEWQAVGDFVRLDARDNPDIDKTARKDIGALLREINPEAARADDEGIFMEPGSFAYAQAFDERRNTVPTLDIAQFITADLIRRAGRFTGYSTLNGVDFQHWPFNAGVSLQAVGTVSDPTWYVTGYLLKEDDEEYFLDEAWSLWDQKTTLWIGDASGTWQDAQHTRGRNSFDKFKARRWRIEPPQVKKSDRGDHPANPSREDRINLVNSLLQRGKLIIVMDKAAPVAEALQKCEVDPKGRPRGLYAHLTDALGYPLWWVTPKPKTTSANPNDARSVVMIPRPSMGPRLY